MLEIFRFNNFLDEEISSTIDRLERLIPVQYSMSIEFCRLDSISVTNG